MTNINQQIIKGISGSDGIALAPAYLLNTPEIKITHDTVVDTAKEIEKFHLGIQTSQEQIQKISEIARETLGQEKASIFEAHREILTDNEIVKNIENIITQTKLNCLAAINQVFDNYIKIFRDSTNPYLKERATDMQDIMNRLLSNISGVAMPDLVTINQPCIIVTNDLTPSQITVINKKFVKGFVTKVGGKTSHSAIIARTKSIPCILSLGDAINQINNGDLLVLDCTKSQVIINPNNQEKWQKKINDFKETRKEHEKYRHLPAITKDKHQVHVEMNIGNADDAAIAVEYGAEGVGLFRTEFLYMHGEQWPNQELQTKNYQQALKYLNNQIVVIRTLDIGGDKKLPYYSFDHEENPFLGYRAIRFCLDKKDVFVTQLRALLQSSPAGKLAIMFPMIASLQELQQAKDILQEEKQKMIRKGIEIANDIQIGMMVEIPAVAICAELFAKHVDFFSIGTNDLIQYTMACDRTSKKVSYLYQPNNPAILKLIKNTIDAAHKYNKWVGICGEMAAEPLAVPLLLGLGIDAFSISAPYIVRNKYMINNLSFVECQRLVQKVLQLETYQEINIAVQKFLDEHKIKY